MLYTSYEKKIMVVITMGIHLLPYRTEKLSPLVPMILLYQVGKQVAANFVRPSGEILRVFFCIQVNFCGLLFIPSSGFIEFYILKSAEETCIIFVHQYSYHQFCPPDRASSWIERCFSQFYLPEWAFPWIERCFSQFCPPDWAFSWIERCFSVDRVLFFCGQDLRADKSA